MSALTSDITSKLEFIKNFDEEKIADTALRAAVSQIIRLFKDIHPRYLQDITSNFIDDIIIPQIKDTYELVHAWSFKPDNDKPKLEEFRTRYNIAFNSLYHLIGYIKARQLDSGLIQKEIGEFKQQISRETNNLQANLGDLLRGAQNDINEANKFFSIRNDEIGKKLDEIEQIKEKIQNIAIEAGVTQQAIYFKNEADAHKRAEESWRNVSVLFAILTIIYCILTIYIPEWVEINLQDAYSAIHFASTKILIFAVLTALFLNAIKNASAHRHNAVVNRHRQNALQTFEAILAASQTPETREIILNHAASCIFAPQDSGFIKVVSGGNTLMELTPRSPIAPGH